ncbi:hypothetical protein RGQ29_022729 [Quercus rubra]|uniref:Protein kinase domain-containing protein n=1 Tax=Quercus rubra TaxID=3512 RepID=A0AAN7F4K9_QUERU|nr:hypothetical protein RGQ29_022729 [Quercus rubra]
MSNGSLANVLFKGIRRPGWDERVRIALDVARGILYLHEECKAPIIHCDIKPSKILMDDFWTTKISDFGLAKLLMPDQTRTFTMVRGTRGYMAPESHKNTPISVKVDVYSYRMVLLEILCCKRNMDVNASKLEEIVLSTWVYKCFVARELDKIVGVEEVDKRTLANMVKVGLWCIQDEPFLRPSMKSVVLMLEGITDISVPPCPTNGLTLKPGKHGHGARGAAPASDAARRSNARGTSLPAVDAASSRILPHVFFFFHDLRRRGSNSGRFALNRADSRQL